MNYADASTHLKWHLRFLRLAQEVSTWSKDPSTGVGAVLINPERRVIGIGFNGFPPGVEDLPERYNDRTTKLRLTVHAEQNALHFAMHDTVGSTLYTTFFPCCQCAAAIIARGVRHVVSVDNPADARYTEEFALSKTMFSEAGVLTTVLDSAILATR